MKRTYLIAIVFVALILINTIFAASNRPPTLNIDESWLILVNSRDVYDITSGTWLQGAYKCQLSSISESVTPDPMVNNFGQNVIIVGGSETLRERAPWNYDLIITKPPSQPDVYVTGELWTNEYIHTPKANYYYPKTVEETETKDYGRITLAYDNILGRWLIMIVGWTAEATAAGVKLFMTMEGEGSLNNVQWIIYRRTNPITILNGIYQYPSLDEWSLNRFTYEILEIGP